MFVALHFLADCALMRFDYDKADARYRDKRHIGSARKELGTEGEAIWEEGRALAFDDAVEHALAQP